MSINKYFAVRWRQKNDTRYVAVKLVGVAYDAKKTDRTPKIAVEDWYFIY